MVSDILRLGCKFSSTIEWLAGLFGKGRRGVNNQPNGTEIYGTPQDSLHCQPEETDVPEERMCNPRESRLDPNIEVNLSRNPAYNIHLTAQNDLLITVQPNASAINPISVKATKDAYVEKYMKEGVFEEDLVAVVKKQLPNYFHGMIMQEEIRNQTKNGSYLIRCSSVTSEIDHCTAMNIENDYKEYFDPSGEPPILKNFFTKDNHKRQLQSYGNNTCGFHCACYLIARNSGLTMDQFIASYPGNLQENDRIATEKFINLKQRKMNPEDPMVK